MRLYLLLAVAAVAQALTAIEWLQSNDSDPLNAKQLSELVPSPAEAQHPWAYYRFSLDHILRLFISGNPQLEPQLSAFDPRTVEDGSREKDFKIGECLYYGVDGTRNITEALTYYQRAADNGHAGAQFMVGVAYSSGFFGNVEPDVAKANLYYFFAANGGDTRAQMALGFRYLTGTGCPRDLDKATDYYALAADTSLAYYSDFAPGIGYRKLPQNAWINADTKGNGIFGMAGQSVPMLPPVSHLFSQFETVEEGLDYLEYAANEEDRVTANMFLARYHEAGGIYNEPDHEQAIVFAQRCIDIASKSRDQEVRDSSAWCHAFIGDRYLRGEGVEPDAKQAEKWYLEGLELKKADKRIGCARCDMGLAYVHMNAYKQHIEAGQEEAAKDEQKQARFYLQKAASQEEYFALFHLAYQEALYGDRVKAIAQLWQLRNKGVLAAYYAAKIYEDVVSDLEAGVQTKDSKLTGDLVSRLETESPKLYRMVAEWNENLHSPIGWCQKVYANDTESAMVGYLVAAEQGYEAAQFNLADLLDVKHSVLPFKRLAEWPVPAFVKNRAETALRYFSRASQNQNSNALLKVAEYYFSGLGVAPSMKRASELFSVLSRSHGGMAYWCLGWMHEHGAGLSKDYHLAKRYYDAALQYTPTAYLPVKLSLVKLRTKIFWNWLTGGKLSPEPTPDDRKRASLWERIKAVRDAQTAAELEWAKSEGYVQEQQDDEEAEGEWVVDITVALMVLLAIVGSLIVRIWRRRRN